MVVAVGVVRFILGVTIAAPAGVIIVAAEVIWMGLYNVSLASLSNNAAFCNVTSSTKNVTLGLIFAIGDRLRSKSCSVLIILAECPSTICMPLIWLANLPALEATPDEPVCDACFAALDQVGVVGRF